MTRALVKRTSENAVQKTEPTFTRWQKFKTVCSALNHFENPRKAIATEGLQRNVGIPEQRNEWREYLVRKGVFDAIGTDVAVVESGEGVYRTALIEVTDSTEQIARLTEIAKEGIGKRYNVRVRTIEMGKSVPVYIGAITDSVSGIVLTVGAGVLGLGTFGIIIASIIGTDIVSFAALGFVGMIGITTAVGVISCVISIGAAVGGAIIGKLKRRAERLKEKETMQLQTADAKARKLLTD